MGLDMYLSRKTYISRYDGDWQITVTKNGQSTNIDPKRISYIEEDIGYWRKANAIHKWFVNNVQNGNDDCGTYYVSEEKLQELLDICQKVLDAPHRAPDFLPTNSGFFFGSTDYGEDYLEGIKYTADILLKALEIKDGTIYYHSSW